MELAPCSHGKTAGLVSSGTSAHIYVPGASSLLAPWGRKAACKDAVCSIAALCPCPGPHWLDTACCQAPRESLPCLSLLPTLCEVTLNSLIFLLPEEIMLWQALVGWFFLKRAKFFVQQDHTIEKQH